MKTNFLLKIICNNLSNKPIFINPWILSREKEIEMKLFEFMKKRKVEEKPQSEIKATESSSTEKEVKIEVPTRSPELYFDDSDIGYC